MRGAQKRKAILQMKQQHHTAMDDRYSYLFYWYMGMYDFIAVDPIFAILTATISYNHDHYGPARRTRKHIYVVRTYKERCLRFS
jgi:hypothetical protein